MPTPPVTAPALPPLATGVCSWSLQVTSVAELVRLLGELGTTTTQIACGDPHHARWEEGDDFPQVALDSGLTFSGAMLGFPGEDYSTPQTIQATGGFGDPATRAERLQLLRWGIDRTRALGLSDLTLHAGFLPEANHTDRPAMLATLAEAGRIAGDQGVTLAFETGQESALLLRMTLDDVDSPNLKVNFDPANMLLYDMGDPIHAVEILGPDIRSVHVKDAIRPTVPGAWGTEVPLGEGQVDIPRFVRALIDAAERTGSLAGVRVAGPELNRWSRTKFSHAPVRPHGRRRPRGGTSRGARPTATAGGCGSSWPSAGTRGGGGIRPSWGAGTCHGF